MKQLYFLFITIGLSAFCLAQTEGASKIYGYKQKVIAGTVRVDDNGNQRSQKPQYNYFIYLAYAGEVMPVEIWVDGEVFSVTTNKISSTPVEYVNPTSGNNKPKILVPKTSRKILQLGTSLNKLQIPIAKGKQLSEKNELVVIYKSKGKLYYKTISKLNELEPVVMQ